MNLVLFYAECQSMLVLVAVKHLWDMLLSVVFYSEHILTSDSLIILHQTIFSAWEIMLYQMQC
jgi:hypothetical protein